MGILKRYPVLCAIALWSCLIVTATAIVVLSNIQTLAGMSGGMATVLAALIGLPGAILGGIAKILGSKD